jgi:DNA-binding transcriptional MerR regulator
MGRTRKEVRETGETSLPRGITLMQAAELRGVEPNLVRYVERARLLPRVLRAADGRLRYSEADVQKLRFILIARNAG